MGGGLGGRRRKGAPHHPLGPARCRLGGGQEGPRRGCGRGGSGGRANADMPAPRAPAVVGPRDGGFGFDRSRKYSSVDNIDEVCVQCQAGQHARCLARAGVRDECECEQCIVFGGA